MITELADTLFENTDLTSIPTEQIKKAAGALGGLDPFNLEKIPKESVFGALDTIKNNSNLSPRQVGSQNNCD